VRRSLAGATGSEAQDLLIDAARSQRFVELAPELEAIALDPRAGSARRGRALAALARLERSAAVPGSGGSAPRGSTSELCFTIARESLPGDEMQRAAVLELVEVQGKDELAWLLELWPSLPPTLRRAALAGFSATAAGARLVLGAVLEDELESRDLDERLAARLREAAADSDERAALDERLASFAAPALFLDGSRAIGPDPSRAT
jgi:hypothetical protein